MLYLTVPIGASAIYADHEVMKKLSTFRFYLTLFRLLPLNFCVFAVYIVLKLNFIEYPKAASTPVKRPEMVVDKQD